MPNTRAQLLDFGLRRGWGDSVKRAVWQGAPHVPLQEAPPARQRLGRRCHLHTVPGKAPPGRFPASLVS